MSEPKEPGRPLPWPFILALAIGGIVFFAGLRGGTVEAAVTGAITFILCFLIGSLLARAFRKS